MVAKALAAVAAVALATAGTAAAATDPIVGSWLFNRSDMNHPATTVTATSSGFDITVASGYLAGAPQGVTFSVAERASLTPSGNADCTIAPNTVVGHFAYASTDAKGVRHYTGTMLKGQVGSTSSTCELIGLQGPYYAKLVEWSDSSQSPPLADGPYNRLCISDEYGGCYVTFDRKGGTTVPAVTVAAPVSGLVPLNPKIPPDARFKTDHTPPTVKAVASSGKRGQPFTLAYYSKDDRGFAGETYRIYSGTKLVKSWGVLAGERDGRLQHAPATLPSSVSGNLTFCVGAQDLNRNRSAWSCAPLTIT